MHVSGAPLLLGVDVGTTACKAALVDLEGAELAHGRAAMPWRGVPGGAEIAPEALLATVLAAMRPALAAAAAGARVLAIGVTSMAEAGVLLDAHGDAVAPVIAWHDVRGGDEAQSLVEALGRERFVTRTALAPRALCSAAKYAWLRVHLPSAQRGVRWLSVAEWVVHRLGGDQAAELSLASRTGFLDVAARRWWDEARDWAQAPASLLPELRQGGTSWGRASAGMLPLVEGAVLSVAGHDHLAGAVGAGVTDAASAFDSCGTAEAVVRAVPPESLTPQVVARLVAKRVGAGWHVLPGYRALLGAQRGGLALQRFLDMLGVDAAHREALEERAAHVAPGAGGMRISDAGGETATLSGIPRTPSPEMVWLCAVEAVVEGGCEILDLVAELGPLQRVAVAGGWSHSPALRAAKRRRARMPIDFPEVVEACARGAALLAGTAAGAVADVAALAPPHAERRHVHG